MGKGESHGPRSVKSSPPCIALFGDDAGTFVFDIDQTYCSQQGKLTENTIIRGEKTKRRKKSKNKQKKYAQRSSHCFVMGLLITPSGIRLPFSVSYYTEAYCKAKKIAHRKQTELAAQLIRQLPLPPEARVVVLGDTAFDAEAIQTACAERKFDVSDRSPE